MNTTFIKIVDKTPLVYRVKNITVTAMLWEVFDNGKLVELTSSEMAELDLQHRLLQAYIDYKNHRVMETFDDALDYVEYLVNELGLNDRLKDRVNNIKKSHGLYETLSYHEIERLFEKANQDYFLNMYPSDVFENIHKPAEEQKIKHARRNHGLT